MEIDSDIFAAELNFPLPKLPLLISIQISCFDNWKERIDCWHWSRNSGTVTINESSALFKGGQWRTERVCVTEKFIRVWMDDQPLALRFEERQDGARLRLSIKGRQRLDNLTIREAPANAVPDVSKVQTALGKIAPLERMRSLELPGFNSGQPVEIAFNRPVDSYMDTAALPVEHPEPAAQTSAGSVPYSHTWNFNSPEASQGIRVLAGSWNYLPHGGPNGTGCMEIPEGRFLAVLDLPDQPERKFPLLLTFGLMVMPDNKAPEDSFLYPLLLKTRGLAEIYLPQIESESFKWHRIRYYYTSDCIDLWSEFGSVGAIVGSRIQPARMMGIMSKGRFRLNNLTVREIPSSEAPDASQYKEAIAKIEPAQRTGTIALPELPSNFPGEPAKVKFLKGE